MKKNPLKPCPFCGYKNPRLSVKVVDSRGRKWAGTRDNMNHISEGHKWIDAKVFCDCCEVGFGFGVYGWGFGVKEVEKEVIEKYNRRPDKS